MEKILDLLEHIGFAIAILAAKVLLRRGLAINSEGLARHSVDHSMNGKVNLPTVVTSQFHSKCLGRRFWKFGRPALLGGRIADNALFISNCAMIPAHYCAKAASIVPTNPVLLSCTARRRWLFPG